MKLKTIAQTVSLTGVALEYEKNRADELEKRVQMKLKRIAQNLSLTGVALEGEKNRADELEKRVQEMEEEIKKYDSEAERLGAKVASLNDTIKQLEADNKGLSEYIGDRNTELKRLLQELQKTREDSWYDRLFASLAEKWTAHKRKILTGLGGAVLLSVVVAICSRDKTEPEQVPSLPEPIVQQTVVDENVLKGLEIYSVVVEVNGKYLTVKPVKYQQDAEIIRGIKPSDRLVIKEINTNKGPGDKLGLTANVVGLVASDGNQDNPDDLGRHFQLEDIHRGPHENGLEEYLKNGDRATENDKHLFEVYKVDIGAKEWKDNSSYFGCFYLQFYKNRDDIEEYVDELRINGRLREALKMAQKGVEIYPESATLHNLAGLIFFLLRNHTDSLIEFRKAWELEPDNAVLNHNLASGYEDLNACKNALPFIKRAVQLDPQNKDYAHDLKNIQSCAASEK